MIDYKFEFTDILKRLKTIENILFAMTDIIDISKNFDKRLKMLEFKTQRSKLMESKKDWRLETLEQSFVFYRQLVEFLKNQNFNPKSMEHVFMHLDTGMLWLKEVISSIPFEKSTDKRSSEVRERATESKVSETEAV